MLIGLYFLKTVLLFQFEIIKIVSRNNLSTMKTILFLGFILLSTATLFAQPVQNVRGKIYDSESNYPLFGAKVEVITSDTTIYYRAITKDDGSFLIENVPVGKYELEIKIPSHEFKSVTIEVNSGRETIVNVPVTEKIRMTDEVVITARKKGEVINEMAVVSSQQFSVEETNRYPGSRMDPARMASMSESSSGLSV